MSGIQIDLSKLSEEERIFYNKYGRLPPKKHDVLNSRLKGERKYFDSGDYALSKAGKSAATDVGSQHPSPERIPHSVPSTLKKGASSAEGASSPIKESSLIHEAALAEQGAQ